MLSQQKVHATALVLLGIHTVYHITVVSRVSTYGHFNVTRDFGPHAYGWLPGIKIPYVCIEAATVKYSTWALTQECLRYYSTSLATGCFVDSKFSL